MELEGDFARDGAVCVRGLVDRDGLSTLGQALDAVASQPSSLAITVSRPGQVPFIEDFCRWSDVAPIEALARSSALVEVARELIDSNEIRLYHDHVLLRDGGSVQATPWHQDQPYYNVDGRHNVSIWIPDGPVRRDEGLRCVAGSHLGPWYLPRTFLDGAARWFPEGTLAETPDIDADPQRFPVLSWDLEPGDAICFHMLTLHAAGGSGRSPRRVLSLRYVGDDATFAPRPWRTSPPFEGLADRLAPGAPLHDVLFPVV